MSHMSVHLAPLELQYVELAKELIRRVWREHFGANADPYVRTFLDRPDAFPDLDDWSHIYAGPFGSFVVVLDGGCVVGTGGIRRMEPHVAELTRMFLLPSYRGRGLGRRIAEHLIRFAREAGYRSVRLATNKQLLASHALYRSLGFQDIPAYERGGERVAYYMELVM
jgi:GNAT superfamily N-acetyltransferase